MSAPRPAHVAILMATFNGAAFLRAQLDSLAAQDHGNWSLWVSDDGSTDATRAILAEFARTHPGRSVNLREGPRRGSTANFMSLLCAPDIRGEFYALADQDDVWLPERLSRGLELCAAVGGAAGGGAAGGGAVLYGARTIITRRDLSPRGCSPLFRRPPDFRNALVQSLAGGNTMLLNAAARSIVQRAGPREGAVCHDWWLYQLLSGAGARVIYDARPSVLYRQHDANQIGSNLSSAARAGRIAALLGGRFRDWNTRNLAELSAVLPLLTPENRERVRRFAALRGRRGPAAVRDLRDLGLYRQTGAGTLSLHAAAFLGLM